MAAGHKPGEEMERRVVPDRAGDREVIPLADHDAPAHEVRDLGQLGQHRGDRVDTELGKGFLDIERRGA